MLLYSLSSVTIVLTRLLSFFRCWPFKEFMWNILHVIHTQAVWLLQGGKSGHQQTSTHAEALASHPRSRRTGLLGTCTSLCTFPPQSCLLMLCHNYTTAEWLADNSFKKLQLVDTARKRDPGTACLPLARGEVVCSNAYRHVSNKGQIRSES